ncbi:inhibitor of apoptosis-promoting Bax1-domain-containing protein [Calycina marina]|uniref:Inhibitor of apoptosis-promoting Bax1-domain-containing protein n=1 Tax=Calycina marina TaxID=1763456 RepID=A0A9P8CF19_9HELO|nr:inhibitor of apoptosis-promoting Bax1-domain-containing protein [Calycina marina]
MSSSTKYTAAPQRDSVDNPTAYTQPPPSYSEPTAQSDHDALLAGSPRSSTDNTPDDFKYGGMVSEATIDIRMAFVRKVYAILAVQLVSTAALSVVSFWSDSYKNWIQDHPGFMLVSILASLVFFGLTFWKRKSYPMNLLFLSAFTLTEAYGISVVTSFYSSKIVLQAVVLTAGIFIALTLVACQTKYDFTHWLPYLGVFLWGVFLFGMMGVFFPFGSTTELIWSGVCALVFSGYILVDTQLVMRHYHVEEEIAAALSLYLDIINLFLAILRILNNTQNN